MEVTELEKGLDKTLMLTADGEREGEMVADFWDFTSNYAIEFKQDPSYKYPHILIRKEI